MLEGEAGIGKTSLWEEGVARARAQGTRVLVCRPAGSEVQLSFAALGDLLSGVLDEVLPRLPSPQRHAVEAALLLADAGPHGADDRALATGFLNVVRLCAEAGPLLLAIDDAQWLDAPSASVLEFALRRLETEPVGVLASVRGSGDDPTPLALDRAPLALDRITVGQLSLGALHELLAVRLALGLSRPVLGRLHTASGGNPFYALEIGRALQRHGQELRPDQQLPLPDSLGELLRERLAGLPARARRTLLFVATLTKPTVALLEAATGNPDATARDLERSARAGLLELDAARIRFSHPLLAAAASAAAAPNELPAVHRTLASVVDDPEERARHLALSTRDPDPVVAASLEEAALAAAARGAPEAAAELAEHAARLTPPEEADDVCRRSIAAAEFHLRAGADDRARELLKPVVSRLPAGPVRAAALHSLARTQSGDLQACIDLSEQALAEAPERSALAAAVRVQLAQSIVFAGGSLDAASAHARGAVEIAEQFGDEPLLATALTQVAIIEHALGRPIPVELLERAIALEEKHGPRATEEAASAHFGTWLMWRGDLDAARPTLLAELERATAFGDEQPRTSALRLLSELELQACNWPLALKYAREGETLARLAGSERGQSAFLPTAALVEAHLGRSDEARAAAEQGLALARRVGQQTAAARALAVLGFIELSLGHAAAAHEYLGPAADLVLEMGIKVLTPFSGLHNEVEALVSLGELERAELLIDELDTYGRDGGSAWATAVAARGRALVLGSRGHVDEALAALQDAFLAHTRLPNRFERARTLLVLGTLQRQARQKRAARETLQQALDDFDGLGSPLWAAKARAELRRIGGRLSYDGELSETERQIADLVASGKTNQEVAEALSLSPKTVEWNLSKVYRKLGVRGRAELAARHGATKTSSPR